MRVLLAYDGSAGATEAVRLAQEIAWPSDSSIRVVSVIEPTMMPISGPWDRGAALAPELDAAITAYAHDTMREVVEHLGTSGMLRRGRGAARPGRQRDHRRCARLPRGPRDRWLARPWDHRVAAARVRLQRGRRPRLLPRPRCSKHDLEPDRVRHRRIALGASSRSDRWPNGPSSAGCRSASSASPMWPIPGQPGSPRRCTDRFSTRMQPTFAERRRSTNESRRTRRRDCRKLDATLMPRCGLAMLRARSSPWRNSEAPISSSSAPAVGPDSPGSSWAASRETSCPGSAASVLIVRDETDGSVEVETAPADVVVPSDQGRSP